MNPFFSTLKDKKVAFIGAGVAHKELIVLFAECGAKVTLCDAKSKEDFGEYAEKLESLGVVLSLGEDYLSGLFGQDMIMRTPGFLNTNETLQAAVKSGVQLTSETEIFFKYCPCKKVAITGSDGKTTTTSLIAQMYQTAGYTVHLGGNIGRALLPMLNDIKESDVAVVELSSFQLITMKPQPDIAVVTNIVENHLNWHKDMQEYIDAKRNILLYQAKDSAAVLNLENEITRNLQADVKGECLWFARTQKLENGAYLNGEGFLCIAKNGASTPVVHKDKLLLRGVHNIENMLAAFAAVLKDVGVAEMAQVAQTFKGVEHRIEPVREAGGVWWFNDSIATSPTRVVAGLRSFSEKLVLIMGGSDKGLPFAPMVADILQHAKAVVLTGETKWQIDKALHGDKNFAQSGLRILHATDMQEAVKLAESETQSGDVVLLSPACAAYDKYRTFEERGQDFKFWVNKL